MKDGFGRTLLHLAVVYDDPIAVAVPPTALGFEAACQRSAQQYTGHRLLTQSQLLVNQQDQRGRSALWHAVNAFNTDLIQRLLRHPRVELNTPDNDGINSAGSSSDEKAV
ncbi:ankyrin repeat-containing domain protein [Penicillium sp. IBT 35674x]|nr:ankyrin repeat-containing domain protein [Penicillium sp. IBT 35674x]